MTAWGGSRKGESGFLLGTSWKMTHRAADATRDAERLRMAAATGNSSLELFVLPPFTLIEPVASRLTGTGVRVGAQNVHWEDFGAFTGEVSAPMLVDVGATIVEIGHSERRTWFGETDETVRLKTDAALRHGLLPLICVGEPAEIRDVGRALEHVSNQLRIAVRDVPSVAEIWVAYEPVWAIGEHGKPANPELVEEILAALRHLLGDLRGPQARTPLLYGGSVDAQNAAAFAALPSADGLFVGRAAWTAEGLLEIAAACAAEASSANSQA